MLADLQIEGKGHASQLSLRIGQISDQRRAADHLSMPLLALSQAGRLVVKFGCGHQGERSGLDCRPGTDFVLREADRLPLGLLLAVRLAGAQSAEVDVLLLGAGWPVR